MQGEPLCPAMLDCVVAACSQIGDSSRAFETFAAYGNLGLTPGAQAYNAVLQGCIYHGLIDSVPKVREPALCMLALAASMQLCCRGKQGKEFYAVLMKSCSTSEQHVSKRSVRASAMSIDKLIGMLQ